MSRTMVDCRKIPSEINCTLTIAGEADEVLDAAVAHAVAKHGHEDSPELRESIRAGLEPAESTLA
jgi:predicted small metal-binding protein